MKDTTQLYIYPASYAHEHGELDQYRASYKASIASGRDHQKLAYQIKKPRNQDKGKRQ